MGADLRPQGLHDASHGAVPLGQGPGERSVLADRQPPGPQLGAEPASYLGELCRRGSRGVQVGARVDAVTADDGRLAAVHGGDGGHDLSGKALHRFRGQRELSVEHDAGRASGDRACGGVQPDPATGPDRHAGAGPGQQPLQQDEGAELADAPPRLAPLRDQPVGVRAHGLRLGGRRHLDEDAP